MSILRVIALFLLMGCAAQTGVQNSDDLDITRADIKRMVQSDNFVNIIVAQQDIPARLVPVYRAHFRELYSDDAFVDRIYRGYRKTVGNVRFASNENFNAQEAFADAVRQTSAPSLLRLPPNVLEEHFSIIIKALNAAPVSECATLVREDFSTPAKVAKYAEADARAITRLDTKTVARHLAISRMAIKASWRNSPAPRKLSRSDIMRMSALIETKLYSGAIDIEKYGNFEAVLDAPNSASDGQVCKAGRAAARLMQDIGAAMAPGKQRDLYYRYVESDI